jgi:hypothetical protein
MKRLSGNKYQNYIDLSDANLVQRTPQPLQKSHDGPPMMRHEVMGGKSATHTTKKKAAHLRASSSVNDDYTHVTGH